MWSETPRIREALQSCLAKMPVRLLEFHKQHRQWRTSEQLSKNAVHARTLYPDLCADKPATTRSWRSIRNWTRETTRITWGRWGMAQFSRSRRTTNSCELMPIGVRSYSSTD